MAPDDDLNDRNDALDEALTRLVDGVNAEPVSENLRQLAQRLAEVLAQQAVAPLSPTSAPDDEPSAGEGAAGPAAR